MALIKTPRAIIDILDADRKVTGHEIEYIMVYEPEGPSDPLAGMMPATIKREVATLEAVQALRDRANDTLVQAHANLNTQLASERTQHAEALAAKDAALADSNAALAVKDAELTAARG